MLVAFHVETWSTGIGLSHDAFTLDVRNGAADESYALPPKADRIGFWRQQTGDARFAGAHAMTWVPVRPKPPSADTSPARD